MPDSIDLHIKNIQAKLQLLLKNHALLIKENNQLKKENENYQAKEKAMTEKTEQLQQQINILKTSAGQMEGKEKMEFEKIINRYIRTIDKCINLLNE
jgi:hypothetical protein